MAVFKMNALATALVFAGMLATSTATEVSYSDCSSTLPVVTQKAGATTSDGTVLSSWSICTVVYQTNCEASIVTGNQVPVSGPTAGASSVPNESVPSYKEGEHASSTYHGETEPTHSAPGQSVPAGASRPPYTDSAQSSDLPEGSGQPSAPGEVPTTAVDVSGKPSSAYAGPSDEEAGPAHSHTGLDPTASDMETEASASASASGPSEASGTPPTTTGTSAASIHDSASAAMLGFVGAVGAVGVIIF